MTTINYEQSRLQGPPTARVRCEAISLAMRYPPWFSLFFKLESFGNRNPRVVHIGLHSPMLALISVHAAYP